MHLIEPRDAFDTAAVLYDQVRPSYPARLVEDVIAFSGISVKSRILEIGAGTGKATVRFTDRGYRIHCIEPGANMARLLLANCSGVTVEVTRFEDWNSPEEFDLIYSAQAFHWVPPEFRYSKTHSMLGPRGCLALFWYEPQTIPCDLSRALDAAIIEIAPENAVGAATTPTGDDRLGEIEESGLYQDVDVRHYEVVLRMTPEEYVGAVRSASWFLALDSRRRRALDARIDDAVLHHPGAVDSAILYRLYLARKGRSCLDHRRF